MAAVPKARAARLGHSGKQTDIGLTQVSAAAVGVPAPPPNPAWHPYALGWYNSLAKSGQSAEYVPSDWMMAVIGAELLDDMFSKGIRAAVLAEFNEISTKLCCTLGDRRRAKIELLRAGVQDTDEAEAATSLTAWRKKMKEKSS